MPLSDIVNVVISKTAPGVTQAGFGVPLIASATGWNTPERTRTYTSIAGVSSDFAAGTPEYQAANAMFAQSPHPTQIMIGRLANKPTQKFVVSITTVVSTAGTVYSVKLYNQGVLQTASFTTVGSDTNDTIATGIMNAINALAAPAPNFTATLIGSIGSKTIQILGNAAANYASIEILDPNLLAVTETNSDPGIVADLTAIAAESSAWYGLILLFKSDAIVDAAAGWVETNSKLFIPALCGTQIATVADGSATDEAHALKASSRARTGVFFHPRGYEFADAAEIARFFPIQPGGDNWRMKTLSGVKSGWGNGAQYTATQITNLETKRCNFYYDITTGTSVIGGNGVVSDNEYIDVIRGLDWWTARLSERIANRLISVEKIPFTDAGVAVLEGEVRGQNAEGIDAGLINPVPRPIVTAPLVATISPSDKAARKATINTQWTLAGAINFLTVNATVLT